MNAPAILPAIDRYLAHQVSSFYLGQMTRDKLESLISLTTTSGLTAQGFFRSVTLGSVDSILDSAIAALGRLKASQAPACRLLPVSYERPLSCNHWLSPQVVERQLSDLLWQSLSPSLPGCLERAWPDSIGWASKEQLAEIKAAVRSDLMSGLEGWIKRLFAPKGEPWSKFEFLVLRGLTLLCERILMSATYGHSQSWDQQARLLTMVTEEGWLPLGLQVGSPNSLIVISA